MEYKMKSAEDFRHSVYTKKLAKDMKTQRRRRLAAGVASVLTAAVVCFGLGLFSAKLVFAPQKPETGAPEPALTAMHGQFDGQYARQHVAAAEDAAVCRDALDLRLVMSNAQTAEEITVQLTNTSSETPLRIVSVRITSPETNDVSEQETLAGLVLQPGESQMVTLVLDADRAADSLFDAEFHYVMDGGESAPLQKKAISLVWQNA